MMMNCEQHDYIEIACLYRYPVILTLNSGDVINGIAIDTTRDHNRQECIQVLVEHRTILVPLAELISMKSAAFNPHFDYIAFN
ncbi:Rho-binding antiterminator [Oceanisphaera sp. W20_SRM_FM3]|uniref:Rho-binding antiterminator n=1 Tax=Oceanisphaera sp. W20_SRM_FM3 TaxID=3240267 RepID=UPI003F9A1D9A